MPQVDIVTFSSQNLWVVFSFIFFVSFITLYFLSFFGVFYNTSTKYIVSYQSKLNNLVSLSNELFGVYNKSLINVTNFYYNKIKLQIEVLDNYLTNQYKFKSINTLYTIIFTTYRNLVCF